MSNVINLLFETEQKARDLVDGARDEAQQIRKEAEDEAEGIIRGAKEEALTLQREALEKVRADLEKEKADLVKDLEERQRRLLSDSDAALDRAADRVMNLVCPGFGDSGEAAES